MSPASYPDQSANMAAPRAVAVFASDARLGLALLNEARYLALRRAFGISRSQANLLTFVLALSGVHAAAGTAQRVMATRLPITGADTLMGGFVMREAGLGIAGPAARETPLLGTLLAIAMVGGLVAPELQRVLRGMHAAERRVRDAGRRFRQQRTSVYVAARQRAAQAREAVTAE
jgi:hypothetical protein